MGILDGLEYPYHIMLNIDTYNGSLARSMDCPLYDGEKSEPLLHWPEEMEPQDGVAGEEGVPVMASSVSQSCGEQTGKNKPCVNQSSPPCIGATRSIPTMPTPQPLQMSASPVVLESPTASVVSLNDSQDLSGP